MAFKLPGGRTIGVVAVGVLAGTLLTAGGSAVASSAGTEVHACVNKKTRYARIVNATAACRATETRVTWGDGGSQSQGVNTQGPQGPAGRNGAQGPAGQQGPQGDRGFPGKQGLPGKDGQNGLPGKDGQNGLPGKQGEQGEQGPRGQDGKDGAPGAKGDTGPRGLPGEKGDTGPRGLQGAEGDKGRDGAPGAKGDTGPRGLQGVKGDTGPQGPKGDPGTGGGTLSVQTAYGEIGHNGGTASCKANEVATGGGYSLSDSRYIVTASMPSGSTSWSVKISKLPGDNDNDRSLSGGGGSKGTVYVMCAKKV
ncbi:hypothetical protein Sros_8979 [Streptosporangium roseum DSM 43021]|uniref:Collagen triple helix repeat protein n=1 Tax=Streptosporangium roseum (strain ATCC 12428 / DSM 43021 / JCM 3005 / KCTC 9067 / NCIMB 10171 / NRRL 2505 / NI 9100) TaxID=479432 RepID=D2B965_STRRD|nr:hypothetical protein Sros_8979 [Streptosporangium roseum DSM 43021]